MIAIAGWIAIQLIPCGRHPTMKIRLVSITKRKSGSKVSCVDELTAEYVKRAARYAAVEAGECPSEEALLKSLERPGRTAPVLVALDARGKQMSSEELAEFFRQHMERGTQELVLAIGPADGWSARHAHGRRRPCHWER